MVVLIILVVGTFLARLAGLEGIAFLDSWPAATRAGLAFMLLFTGSGHFNSMRHDLARMVPPSIPHAMGMIYFTGVCEITGGLGLLIPATRVAASIALIVFFLAILPANIYAAKAASSFGARRSHRWSGESRCRCCLFLSPGGRGCIRAPPQRSPWKLLLAAAPKYGYGGLWIAPLCQARVKSLDRKVRE